MQKADILNRRLAFAATSLRRRINSRLKYIIIMKPSVFTIGRVSGNSFILRLPVEVAL